MRRADVTPPFCRGSLARTLLLGLLLVVSCAVGAAEKKYAVGVVPQFEQRKLLAIWRPLLDELEKRTGLTFELVGAPSIPAFEKQFQAGAYDFAYLNPYLVIKARETQAYQPLVRDKLPLHGVLVVRRDSPIQTLAELNGKEIVFPSPNAVGASLLMRADLARIHGIEIKPRYVQSHSSVYLHVAQGLAVAGGGVAKTLSEQKEPVREALRVLYTTRPMPSHLIAAHPRVPEKVREAVKRALLEMSATVEGRVLLSEIPMAQAVPASAREYDVMRDWGLDAFYVNE